MWATSATLLASALLTAGAGLVAVRPFFGVPVPAARGAHEAPMGLLIGPALLAMAGLLMGSFPDRLVAPLVQPALRFH